MSSNQAPHSVLMIRPVAFGFNDETASSNSFQQNPDDSFGTQNKAVEEFDRMVDLLRSHEIDVRVFDDSKTPIKPDVLFPNNWISFHADGKVILYPMLAENRRAERRMDIIEVLKSDFRITETIDLSGHEISDTFLEGTGSLVFDYVNRIAYACRSPRTDEQLVEKICALLRYKPIIFNAVDQRGQPVYHTNVMMCVGSKFVVICLDSILSESDQDLILDSFEQTGHKVVAISYDQMSAFAGNMIEVRCINNEPIVLLSSRAFNSLLPGQVDAISRHVDMIPIPIDTIEKIGGGSVRCMVAGIYLPVRVDF